VQVKLPVPRSFNWKRLALIAAGLAVLGIAAFAGTVVISESNEFCISCHELDYAYKGWEQSTHVNNPEGVMANCVDCHVPPQLSDLALSKVDSLNELYAHWFKPSSDPFWWQQNLPRLRERARERLKDDNCLRCHKWRFEPRSPEGKIAHATAFETTRCVQCHQYLVHNATPPHTIVREKIPAWATPTPAAKP
jgi:nitrate/TMAO reductase-like tetraheme cytochrome c subunit